MEANVKDDVIYSSPRSDLERLDLATACVRNLGIKLPALVDHIEDSTEHDYTGWPDRLYVIDSGGRIAYKSQPGPFGFKPAEMEEALVNTLASNGSP